MSTYRVVLLVVLGIALAGCKPSRQAALIRACDDAQLVRATAPAESFQNLWGQYDDFGFGKTYWWNVRLGALLPSSGSEANFDTGILGGVCVRLKSKQMVSFETGIDFGAIHCSEKSVDSTLYAIRFDTLLAKLTRPSSFSPYGLLGGQFLIEGAYNKNVSESDTLWSFDINVGGGVRSIGKRIDIRGTYSMIANSNNVPGVFLLSVGTFF